MVAASMTAALLAGCGGDDGGGEQSGDATTTAPSKPASDSPRPKEPLADAARRLERAVAKGDCEPLARLMIHSVVSGREPGDPPTAQDCRYVKTEARVALRGFKAGKVRELGPAGFSEGTGGAEVVGSIWILDVDGSWKAVFSANFRRQIGVQPESPDVLAAHARGFVSAVAARDCDRFWLLLHVGSRFVRARDGDKARFCKGLPASYRKGGLADLAAEPGAQPEELGTMRDTGFYGLPLRNGRYLVLVLTGPLGGIADDELKDHAIPSVIEFVTARAPG